MNRDRLATTYDVGFASAPGWEISPILGIVVDAPDVLYDATLWRRWLLRLVSRMGLPGDSTRFLQDWDSRYLADVHCGRRETTEALQSFLLAWGFSWAQVDEIEAASRMQRESLEYHPRALPGVVKTIARLSELGLPLVAWCDAPHSAAQATDLFELLGMAGRFQAVLSSLEIEHAQPESECYVAMLDRLSLPGENVAYVGHDGAHLAAAKGAGLRTVAFNFHETTTADVHLTRFEDLLSLVHASSCSPCGDRPSRAAGGGAVFEPYLSPGRRP